MTRKLTSIALVGATLIGASSLLACNGSPDDTKVGSDNQTQGVDSKSTAAETALGGGMSPQSTIDQNPTAAGVPRSAPAASSSHFLSVTDTDNIQQAAQKGLFEMEAAKLASQKAADPAVKAYAIQLHQDELSVATQLQQLAQRYNVNLPGVIPAEKRSELTQLNQISGSEFDKQFLQTVAIQDLKNVISLFEEASQQAVNPEVKTYFESVLPTLRAQLIAARQFPQVTG